MMVITAKICPSCKGDRFVAMNQTERRERAGVLARAKRRGQLAPKLERHRCETCDGKGWVADAP